MKKTILLFILSAIIISCGGTKKKTQTALNTGNYDSAINTAIENLKVNKTRKNKQDYVLMLEEAFAKASQKDLQEIQFLERDGNPANLENVYNIYLQLEARQERIRPLLPLPVLAEGRDARFDFKNYTNDIVNTKNRLSQYLYANASKMLQESNNKFDVRDAYKQLDYLNAINPNYNNTRALMEEALRRGTDFVMVNISNETEKVIPSKLEEDLLNFNGYGIKDIWTVYHSNPVEAVNYDYEMRIAFRDIIISPEKISERQLSKERQIKDGWQYLEDENGKVVKDSVGEPIKVDKFTTVTCTFYEFTQQKSVQVKGQVTFNDLNTQQTINTYPLASQFIFQHIYANFSGDKRALEDNLLKLLDRREVPFPSNEQMVYDAGEDLKNNLKAILSQQRFY